MRKTAGCGKASQFLLLFRRQFKSGLGTSLRHTEAYSHSDIIASYLWDIRLASFGTKNTESGQLCVYGLLPARPCFTGSGETERQVTNGRIALSWMKSAAATMYSVKRSIEGADSFQVIASGVTTPAFLDYSAQPGKTYEYKVTAVNSNGESGDSDVASVLLPKASSPHHVVH